MMCSSSGSHELENGVQTIDEEQVLEEYHVMSHGCDSPFQESQVLIRSRGGRKRSLSENWLEHKPATTVDNGERRELEMRLWLSGQDKAHIHNLVHFCKHNQCISYCLFDQLALFPAR